MNNDLLYKIAITKIPKVGAVTARTLIGYCGGAKGVFEASKKELIKMPGIGPTIAANVINQEVLEAAEKELNFIEKNNIQCLFYTDQNYPQRLKSYNDSPVLLFHKGNAELNHTRIVSIIGTRMPSFQNKAICEKIVEGLLKYNVLILSGLAYGIDVTAHKKSVEMGIPTVGVLGHGLGSIYPPDHKTVAEDMIKNGGLLSEYTSKTPPDREHFPMRNRIVAGMCDALVVVETKRRGGSMITAMLADGYNKDIFAVPGRAGDKKNEGCNYLIKSHKAELVETAEDLAKIMHWEELDRNKNIQTQLFVELSGRQQSLVDILKSEEEISIDKISQVAQLPPSEVSSLLLELEFKGLVKTLPGKRYVLV